MITTFLAVAIAITNSSTVVSSTQASEIAEAIQDQITNDFAPAWSISAPTVTFYSNGNQVPSGDYILSIIDSFSGGDGIEYGYHTVSGSIVYGQVAAADIINYGGGNVLWNDQGFPTVSEVSSHEILEMLVNPNINLWVQGPNTDYGNMYAEEDCDPINDDYYSYNVTSGDTVGVSDFVFPAFFNQNASNVQFDQLSILTSPFSMDYGGYMIVEDSSGNQSVIFGSRSFHHHHHHHNVFE